MKTDSVSISPTSTDKVISYNKDLLHLPAAWVLNMLSINESSACQINLTVLISQSDGCGRALHTQHPSCPFPCDGRMRVLKSAALLLEEFEALAAEEKHIKLPLLIAF